MPQVANGIAAQDVHTTIKLLIEQLVNIQDTTGEFLLRLDDGRVIDTKGWNGWEWTHGIGLYGLWNYHTVRVPPLLLHPNALRCSTYDFEEFLLTNILVDWLSRSPRNNRGMVCKSVRRRRHNQEHQHHGIDAHPRLLVREDRKPTMSSLA